MRVLLASVLLACACATTRQGLGDLRLRPYTDPTLSPTVFSVQEGRIFSPALDMTVEPDGCLRGTVGETPIALCSQARKADSAEPGATVEHWAGSGGDFTLETLERGTRLRMDGYVRARAGTLPLQATVPFGKGPQWDELRKHPALLALAAAAAGVRGEPDDSALRDAQ